MSLVPQYIQIICNKATCRENDGKKSTMIKPFCDTKMKITQKMLFSSDKSDNESKNIQFDYDTTYEETDSESDDSEENIIKKIDDE